MSDFQFIMPIPRLDSAPHPRRPLPRGDSNPAATDSPPDAGFNRMDAPSAKRASDDVKPPETPASDPKGGQLPDKAPEKQSDDQRRLDANAALKGSIIAQSAPVNPPKTPPISSTDAADEEQKSAGEPTLEEALKSLNRGGDAGVTPFSTLPTTDGGMMTLDERLRKRFANPSRSAYLQWEARHLHMTEKDGREFDLSALTPLSSLTPGIYRWQIRREDVGGDPCSDSRHEGEIHRLLSSDGEECLRIEYWNCYPPYWGAALWRQTRVLLAQPEIGRLNPLHIRAYDDPNLIALVELNDLSLTRAGGIIRLSRNRVCVLARDSFGTFFVRDTQTQKKRLESDGLEGELRLMEPDSDGIITAVCLLVEHHVRWLHDQASVV